jgi:hypothetical protein
MDRDYLLNNPPAGLDSLAALWSWSENEDWQTGDVWRYFLDATGYSLDNFGDTVNPAGYSLDYVGMSKVADALQVFSRRPDDCREYMANLEFAE